VEPLHKDTPEMKTSPLSGPSYISLHREMYKTTPETRIPGHLKLSEGYLDCYYMHSNSPVSAVCIHVMMYTIFNLDAENEGVRVLLVDLHFSPSEVRRVFASDSKSGKG
jgi:hypothetical protein